MQRWGTRALVGSGAVLATVILAVAVVRGGAGESSPVAQPQMTPIVAVPSEPSGLPSVMPSGDPYQPSTPLGPPTSSRNAAPPYGPETPPPPGPLGPPPTPGGAPPTPGPTGPSAPIPVGRVDCTLILLPGPSPTTVRMVLTTTPDVTKMWILVRDRGSDREDVLQVTGGYAERVVTDVSRESATVTAYSSPNRSPESQSCQFG